MSKITLSECSFGAFRDGGRWRVAATIAALSAIAIVVAVKAQESSVTIQVVDAQSHVPISEFVVTPGFTQASDMLTWESDRSVTGTNGLLEISYLSERSYQFKVEARGYLPEMASRGRTNADGAILFEMEKGEGFGGKVVGTNGSPVREAQVALNVKFGDIWLTGHKMTIPGTGLKVHRSTIVTTDEEGKFFIPAIAGVLSLVICSEQGFAEVPKEILKTNMTIHLQPWDRSAETANNLGLFVELRTNGAAAMPGKAPELLLDIRRSNGSDLLTSTNSKLRRIEIDGNWYGADLFPLAPLSVLKPGASWTNITVVVDRAWHETDSYFSRFSTAMFAADGGSTPRGISAERFRLKPGKHTVRMAVYAARPGLDTVGVVRAVSNPVEFEMLPDPKDVALGSFGPEIKLTIPKLSEASPAYLNLKTGKMVETRPPGDLVRGTGEGNKSVRYALDMTTVNAGFEGWDATPSEVMDALAKARPQKEAIVDEPKSWNIYFFKTREGTVGIMQLLPEGISYRLLQPNNAKN